MQIANGFRLGPYEILAPLGQGGMGEVYRARDAKLRRDVAIKILPASFALDPDRSQRFEREAQVLASLNHPHIGAIYGFEETAGIRGLVLELVEGETLAEALARSEDRALPVNEVLAIARQIVDALDAAHERGIVHRDLKPANIKITPAGVVKVLDFGLAKTLGSDPASGAADLTNSPTLTVGPTGQGVLLGTAPYMSPEQARGRAVDKRTDIWAFGCVLYEMLTGRPVYGGDTLSDTLVAILTREPDWTALPTATPSAIRRLLPRCLEKDPSRRLRDIGDARTEIDDAASGKAEPAPTPAETASVAGGGTRLAWSVAAVAGLALVSVLAWSLWSATRTVAAPRLSRAIRLTNTSAHEFGPAISPDGKWVAYYSNARGATNIWVKFLESSATLNLTASQTLDLQIRSSLAGLDISPDGGTIAFTARAKNATTPFDTWVMPGPIGGAARKLLTDRQAMRWSPDGKQLTYVQPGATRGDTLFVANSDGTGERKLIPVMGGRHIHWPEWSRDSQHIYFIYTFGGRNGEPSEIYRIRASGGAPEPVVRALRRAIYPVPLPGNTGMLFAANPNSVDLGLWWKPAGPGEPKPLTTAVGEHTEPRLSADGRTVVTTLAERRQTLLRVPVRFDQPVQAEPITDGYTGDLDPSVDLHNDRIVFSSSRSGNRNLWLSRRDGSQPTPLTAGTSIDERPAFSPDGQQVAFVSDRGGQRGIWVVSADGGAPRLVGPAIVLDVLTWSPDGKRIVYATPAGDLPELASILVTDGKVEPFRTPAAGHAPSWSWMTDRVAYLEPTSTGRSQTWVAFVDGRGQPLYRGLPQPSQPFQNGFVAWSPDGSRLAAVSAGANTATTIWIVEPAAQEPFKKLIDLPVTDFPRGMTWTPDGSAVIIATEELISDIVLFDLDR